MKTPFSSDVLEPKYPATLEYEVDFSLAAWTGASSSKLLDVTGVVRIVIVAVCTEDIVSTAGSFYLGDRASGNTGTLIRATDKADMVLNHVWCDNSDSACRASNANYPYVDCVAADDIDITTPGVSAGKIKFYIWWNKISSDGNVTIGDGS